MREIKLSMTPTSLSKYYTCGDGERFRNSILGNEKKFGNNKGCMLKANEAKKKKNAELSYRARKRIRNAVNWLCLLSAPRHSKYSKKRVSTNFRIGFWTLTLPSKQLHSHAEIKKVCLNNFLTVMRQKFKMHNYVWVAELQKNGNIHFHITTDVYVHYYEIRRIWNQSIELLGYVTAYKHTFESMSYEEYAYWRRMKGASDKKKILKSYNHGQNSCWRDPNTTDVKSVRNIKNLAAYLSKYMAKGNLQGSASGIYVDSFKQFNGRRWYLSQSLSKLGTVKIDFDMRVRAIFEKFCKLKDVFRVSRDFVDMVFFRLGTVPKLLKEFLREELLAHALSTGYVFQGDFNLILR